MSTAKTLPTFLMAHKDAREPFGEPVPYHPIRLTAGDVTHTLALHKTSGGAWKLSCPKFGAAVLTISGTYRGITCCSAGMTYSEVRRLAREQFDSLVGRIGADKFNAVLAKGTVK